MEMTTPTPETLRAIRPCPLCGRWDGTHREGCQWSAAADAWERTLKIVEARPDDPYPDEELGLSEDAHQWVQEIWRTARIHQADAIKLRARLAEAERENTYLRANMPMSVLRRLQEQAALTHDRAHEPYCPTSKYPNDECVCGARTAIQDYIEGLELRLTEAALTIGTLQVDRIKAQATIDHDKEG